ncbi:LytR C-terminal domain-containing protein [Mycobacterium sp. MYCO198283]|uniref:LytR C-terminal domain-containing protein n=1 Tax=Mycobacterium sp. MYCO198283 TaxID=2883505 RepID=UPI001E42DCAF|nr:LytR C-terminal domain-containing protein [Mycobacterium sp. MYCO198283]MCG5432213.1 LytR C-terminal domain-containing protein [Mycobacterium sp. MYCO198283]
MNDRVPDSSGLPLRAIIMVLLFLGVVFLLVGFQAMGGDDDASSTTTAGTTTTATSAAPTSAAVAAPRPPVIVLNRGETPGLAESTAAQLRADNWNVVKTGNTSDVEVTGTTVFYADPDRAAAEQIGDLLKTGPPELRPLTLGDEPAGVVVVVTG